MDHPCPEHLRALAECSPDAIFITHFDSAKFVDANSKACTLFGFSVEEFRTMTGRHLHDKDDSATVDAISRELIANSKAFWPAVRLRRKDGSFLWAELRSSTYQCGDDRYYVVFIRDISNERALKEELQSTQSALQTREAQLRQNARTTTVGSLSGDVIHEVNNPASVLQMNLEVLFRRLRSLQLFHRERSVSERALLSGVEQNVGASLRAVERIAKTMRCLRTVSSPELTAAVPVELNEVVREACQLLSNRLERSGEFVMQLGAPPKFFGERGRWLQLVINLLLNAYEAVEAGGNYGLIVITTGLEGDGAFLEVSDNGPGVPDELSETIFKPFVTTRSERGALGLGLSSCLEIARQHRATLTLRRPPQGASFRVQIPRRTGLSPRPRVHRIVQ